MIVVSKLTNMMFLNNIADNTNSTEIHELMYIFMIILYWIGISVARVDREAGLANTDLPSWWRRILFLSRPNPFRKRTIIYQAILIVMTIITLTINFAFPNTRASLLLQRVYLIGMVFLMIVCDMRIRK